MTFSLQKTALFLALLVTQAYGRAPEAISVANKEVIITAKAMTAGECLDTFYKDLRDDRIFPVAICIHNKSNKPLKLNAENIEISGAKLLTPKKIESKISSMRLGTLFFAVIFFPFAFWTNHEVTKLKALMPIIKKCSIDDSSIVIQPQEKIERILFIEIDYPKNANGESLYYFTPEFLDIEVSLKNNIFFSLQGPLFFELHVPTV